MKKQKGVEKASDIIIEMIIAVTSGIGMGRIWNGIASGESILIISLITTCCVTGILIIRRKEVEKCRKSNT